MDRRTPDQTTHLETRATSHPARRRRATPRFGFALTLAAALGLLALPGCEDESPLEEAIEEVEDEAGDARRNIEDEIDDAM